MVLRTRLRFLCYGIAIAVSRQEILLLRLRSVAFCEATVNITGAYANACVAIVTLIRRRLLIFNSINMNVEFLVALHQPSSVYLSQRNGDPMETPLLLKGEKITTRLSLKYAKLSVKLFYDHY